MAAVAWAVALSCLPLVTPEQLWSAVSAVTGPQSAAWAAVPGTVNTVYTLYTVSYGYIFLDR